MGEDREKVIASEPDDALVAEDVEGHAVVSDLVEERGALLEDDDVEGHSLVNAPEDLVE